MLTKWECLFKHGFAQHAEHGFQFFSRTIETARLRDWRQKQGNLYNNTVCALTLLVPFWQVSVCLWIHLWFPSKWVNELSKQPCFPEEPSLKNHKDACILRPPSGVLTGCATPNIVSCQHLCFFLGFSSLELKLQNCSFDTLQQKWSTQHWCCFHRLSHSFKGLWEPRHSSLSPSPPNRGSDWCFQFLDWSRLTLEPQEDKNCTFPIANKIKLQGLVTFPPNIFAVSYISASCFTVFELQ